ncbi:MAG: glutamyl-tRNA reductase [Arcobacteraceae bacterium]|nr:glutamyl-tRNA reductase [Arcobacteraceae bacterium]
MEYLIVSFTHKNTDIQTREKLAFSNDLEKEMFLKTIVEHPSINEAILISTCNRVEFILSVNQCKDSGQHIIAMLAKRSNINLKELLGRADIYENEGAIHHLFTVASSLDSLVVGETQIAGQLKDSFKFSIEKAFSGQKLARVMHYSFKCAARVRTATSLGTGSVSVASTAVAKAKELYNGIDNVKAIVIGAGEMSELAIKHLLKSGFEVIICSRNLQKAKTLANSFEENIEVESYDKLEELLNSKRLLFTATSAPYPIIKCNMVKKCGFQRNWFDIAVPRDIEDINSNDLNIYSVDDLQGIVDENVVLRADAAKIAYGIVGKITIEFFSWIKTLSVEPTIKHLYLSADEIIERKINNALKKGFIKLEDEKNIHKLCKTIVSEFLHKPSSQLREVSKSMEGDIVLGTTQNLFGLKEDSDMLNKYKCEHALDSTI